MSARLTNGTSLAVLSLQHAGSASATAASCCSLAKLDISTHSHESDFWLRVPVTINVSAVMYTFESWRLTHRAYMERRPCVSNAETHCCVWQEQK